jgi:hypothetical protein
MDLAAAEERHDLVAGLLQPEPAAHGLAMIARHVDGALVAQEVGRVQHDDVQRVALDPFTAIEEAPQVAQLAGDGDPERALHGVHRAHLIGDRADAADARGDVRRLGESAAAQQRLEEARRLEDAELGAAHLAVAHHHLERALALDAGEEVDLDRLGAFSPNFARDFSKHLIWLGDFFEQ